MTSQIVKFSFGATVNFETSEVVWNAGTFTPKWANFINRCLEAGKSLNSNLELS